MKNSGSALSAVKKNYARVINLIRSLAMLKRRLQASVHLVRAKAPSLKQTAPSLKLQAPSLLSHKPQASSPKHKGSSFKPQASSSMILAPLYM